MTRPGLRSDLHDLRLVIVAVTDRAICVAPTPDSDSVWLPLSQIEVGAGVRIDGLHYADVTAPEWLLRERGLV